MKQIIICLLLIGAAKAQANQIIEDQIDIQQVLMLNPKLMVPAQAWTHTIGDIVFISQIELIGYDKSCYKRAKTTLKSKLGASGSNEVNTEDCIKQF